MARKQIRNRRHTDPVVLRAAKAKIISDGFAKCQLSADQITAICVRCRISEDADSRYLSGVSHEIEIIVERYWQNDARRQIWPSDSTISGTAKRLVAITEQLETLLKNKIIRIPIENADLLENGRVRRLRGMFNVDGLEASLEELRIRAQLVQSYPGGRETLFKSKSNAQDRPFDMFLCELVRFWYLEMGNSLAAQGKKGGKESNVYDFCQYLAEIGGRSIARPALQMRVRKVLKTMDGNDNYRRLKRQQTTHKWTI